MMLSLKIISPGHRARREAAIVSWYTLRLCESNYYSFPISERTGRGIDSVDIRRDNTITTRA